MRCCLGIFRTLADRHPELKRKLVMARIDKTPEQYLRSQLTLIAMLTVTFTFVAYLIVAGLFLPMIWVLITFVVSLALLYHLLLKYVEVIIRKRAKEIDRDVLFAGRFLLVKLNSGAPLSAALVEASRSYGVASKTFKEIVRDIELGTPLEEALEKASRYNPSERFRKIIFQIANALKIGIDVTRFLEATLDEIAQEQLIEIQRYGKKLSGLAMIYMLLAIVIPSLGITLMITIVSFLSFKIDMAFFLLILFGMLLIQFFFITIFKTVRPNVNV